MVVVLIIGILVAVAVPLFVSNRAAASQKVCLSSQRHIEVCAALWTARDSDNDIADMAGIVGGTHLLITENILRRPPLCPSGAEPADPANPTPAEGAYTLDDEGTVADCGLGLTGPHGHY